MSKVFVVGSINMDLVIKTDVVPQSGETVSGCGFMTNPGGKGANQAVAVAKSGGQAYMVGCVGDEFGQELTQTLQGYGVDATYVSACNGISSGIAVIVVHDGDNRIILDSGANGRVDSGVVEKALQHAQPGDYLVTQLEIPLDTVCHALKLGKQKGMITVLNPAPAATLPDDVWQYVDYFIPNQTESQFYTGILPETDQTALSVAQKFWSLGVKNVVITLGSVGSIALSEGKQTFVPACKVKAVDTTAAGDTFVGALVTKLCEGASLEEAMTFATKASALTVQRKGAQQSIPYRSEIS